MRVRFGGNWIADSENVLLLFEPGRYPMAYFRETDVSPGTLERTEHTTRHPDLGLTSWYTVRAGEQARREGRGSTPTCPPTRTNCRDASRSPGRPWTRSTKKTNGSWATPLTATTASTFASRPVNLVVRHRDRIIADTKRPVVLYESGFAPRWYVLRADIDESALTPWNTRPSARTKGCAATTTSVTRVWRHGRILRPMPRSAASPTWCRSSRTSSPYSSMAHNSTSSRVRR